MLDILEKTTDNQVDESSKIQHTRACRESYFLKNSEQLKILTPLTEFAAQWWGKETNWDCASRVRNNFTVTNKSGPLFFILLISPVKLTVSFICIFMNVVLYFLIPIQN